MDLEIAFPECNGFGFVFGFGDLSLSFINNSPFSYQQFSKNHSNTFYAIVSF